MNKFQTVKSKMQNEKLPSIVIKTFEYYYKKLLNGESGLVYENDIQDINELPKYESLNSKFEQIGQTVLNKSVIIKLNGGLGTSMGLSDAKSLLKVKNNLTFLDIIARQAINSKIPLILMNSFNTQENSIKKLNEYEELKNNLPLEFLQHKVPKISVKTLLPVSYSENPKLEWCPPGHGEIYTALVTSGMLKNLLDEGIKYAFISNSDNLGAVLDYKILGYFAKNDFPFLMEVANRTEADKKGGHLAMLNNGQLILRESAQCSKDDESDFQDITKHKYFNTNNIWINLSALQDVMKKNDNILGLPMLVNKKKVDPKDPGSEEVYQLETAMGSAISVFKGATALLVPRTRFAPVKTTEDLLAVRSDNYILTEDFRIILNPKRKLKPLLINLDKRFYKLIDDLDSRINEIPSLVDCERLSITGDIKFNRKLKFEGIVNLENNSGKQILIDENYKV